MNERRCCDRFDLATEAMISVTRLPEIVSKPPVMLRDISCHGGYFITGTPLPVGTEISLKLTLITEAKTGSTEARLTHLTLKGRVCRMEPRGMAIRFDPEEPGTETDLPKIHREEGVLARNRV